MFKKSSKSSKFFIKVARIFIFSMALNLSNLGSLSAAPVQSNFNMNADGWYVADWNSSITSIVTNYSVTWHATGGNPEGYISSTDPSGNWFWFAAPTKFLGDQSAAYECALQFDLFDSYASATSSAMVILTGNGQRLYYSDDSPNRTSFTSYSVPLITTGWKLNDYINGIEPSVTEMQTILGNLTGLYIDGDWHDGDDFSGLDNVILTNKAPQVPVPVPFILFGSGLIGLFGLRKFRKGVEKI